MKFTINNLVLTNIIFLISIIVLCVLIMLFILNSVYIIPFEDIQHYTLSDLANAQIINLKLKTPTLEDYQKCDINLDNKINEIDVQIIRCILLKILYKVY